jgi:hypothetical protein
MGSAVATAPDPNRFGIVRDRSNFPDFSSESAKLLRAAKTASSGVPQNLFSGVRRQGGHFDACMIDAAVAHALTTTAAKCVREDA